MIDALLAGGGRLRGGVADGAGFGAALEAAADAAEEGMRATIPLVARKGRASYLGERSAGHQDPGATSSALLVRCAARDLDRTDHEEGDATWRSTQRRSTRVLPAPAV